MNWIEVNLYTTTQGTEPVCAVLAEAGVTGVQIEDIADMKNFLNTNSAHWDYIDEELLAAEDGEACIRFYLSDNASGMESLAAVKSAISALARMDVGLDLGRLELETKTVDDGWLDNWKKYYKPFEVGKNIVIRPVWESYDNTCGKTVFTIEPGHVFGTGLHQSTRMCIERLEELVSENTIMLDLGCGSGILSVIGLLLGARSALAVDIDPNAVDIAYGNAALNDIKENYRVLSGDVLTDAELRSEVCAQKYDIVVANIVADVIIAMSEFAAGCIKKGGFFVTSGIIRERLEEVRDKLIGSGFEIVLETFEDDWVCVTGRRS